MQFIGSVGHYFTPGFVCSNVINHHIIIIIIIDHHLNCSPARAQCYHRHHIHQTCCLVV